MTPTLMTFMHAQLCMWNMAAHFDSGRSRSPIHYLAAIPVRRAAVLRRWEPESDCSPAQSETFCRSNLNFMSILKLKRWIQEIRRRSARKRCIPLLWRPHEGLRPITWCIKLGGCSRAKKASWLECSPCWKTRKQYNENNTTQSDVGSCGSVRLGTSLGD